MEPETGVGAQAERLTKLADLHRASVLSDEEYEAAAARVVTRAEASPAHGPRPTEPPLLAAPPESGGGIPPSRQEDLVVPTVPRIGDAFSFDLSASDTKTESVRPRMGKGLIAGGVAILLIAGVAVALSHKGVGNGRTPRDAAIPTETPFISPAPSTAPSSYSPPPPAVLPSGTYRWSGSSVPLALSANIA